MQEKNTMPPSLHNDLVVSIVTATYNRAHFLRGFLESVGQQTYPHWEAVIVDNNSHDETQQLVREFANRFPQKIIYIRLPDNVGFTPAIEEGIQEASGELLMFMGDDDLVMPEMLEKSVAEFRRNPELGLVYTNLWVGAQPGERQYFPSTYTGVHNRKLLPEEFLDLRIWGKTICAQASVFPRRMYEALGGFKYNEMQDTDFFFRLSTNYQISYVPEVLAFSRKHVESLTHKNYEAYARIRFAYWKEKLGTGSGLFQRRLKTYLANQYIRHARFYLEKGHFDYTLFRKYIRELFSVVKLHASWRPYYYLILAMLPAGVACYIDNIKRRLYN